MDEKKPKTTFAKMGETERVESAIRVRKRNLKKQRKNNMTLEEKKKWRKKLKKKLGYKSYNDLW